MKIISIEGIDGTGKTSVMEGIKTEYGGKECVYISFPTDKFYEEYENMDRSVFYGDGYEEEVNRLQAKDKIREFKKWKEAGKEIMFCDRYELSQKVYNGKSLRLDTLDTGIKSDYVIYLQAEVDIVLKRIKEREIEDYLGYEEEATLEVLKKRYESILEKEYQGRSEIIHITDKTEVEDNVKEALNILRRYLSKESQEVNV